MVNDTAACLELIHGDVIDYDAYVRVGKPECVDLMDRAGEVLFFEEPLSDLGIAGTT